MRGGRAIRLGISLAISVALVVFGLRGKDLAGALAALSTARWEGLIPYGLSLGAIHLFRSERFRLLLQPQLELGFLRANRVTAVGNLALLVLPLRLGEVARAVLVSGTGAPRARFGSAMALVVVERVIDGLAVAAMLLVSLLWATPLAGQAARASLVRSAGIVVAAGFAGVLVGLLLAARLREPARRLIQGTLGRLLPALSARVEALLDTFVEGLDAMPRGPALAGVFLHTAGYWAVNGFGVRLLGGVFGIELSWVEAFAVLGVLVVALMIPAAPGMVGTFQAGVQLAIGLFLPEAVAAREGLAYAHVMWLLNFGFQAAIGLVFLALWDEAPPLTRLTRPLEPTPAAASDAPDGGAA